MSAKAIEAAITQTIQSALREHDPILSENQSIADYQSAKNKLNELVNDKPAPLLDLVRHIDLRKDHVTITLDSEKIVRRTALDPDVIKTLSPIRKPFAIKKRGVEQKLIIGDEKPQNDLKIQRQLTRAHHWVEQIKSGKTITEIAQAEGKSPSFIRTRITLAFLSPKIQRAIMLGGLPIEITLEKLVRTKHPTDWKAQEQRLGIG